MRPARDANFINFYARYNNGPYWIHTTFGRPGPNESNAGDVAFFPMGGRQIDFTTNSVPGSDLLASLVSSPMNDLGDDWWMDRDDLRYAWLWMRNASCPDADLFWDARSIHIGGERETHRTTSWNPSDGPHGINAITLDMHAPKDGALSVEMRLRSPDAPAQLFNDEIIYIPPMAFLDEAEGIRLWNGGIGGWGFREHSRNNPSQFPFESPGQYYTDEALEQFYAAVASTGHPIDTLVFALGANDTWTGTSGARRLTADSARRAIERHAREARKHINRADLQVLLVAPYAIPNTTPSQQWINADHELWLISLIGTNNALAQNETVGPAKISYVSLNSMMDGIELDDYDPTWQEASGGVHPSPVGADGLGALIQSAIEQPAEPVNETPAVRFETVVRVDTEGYVHVELLNYELGSYTAEGQAEASDVASFFLTMDLNLFSIPRPSPDLNLDGRVDGGDLAVLLGNWGNCGSCAADMDLNGQINGLDLAVLLAAWGTP